MPTKKPAPKKAAPAKKAAPKKAAPVKKEIMRQNEVIVFPNLQFRQLYS